jgi:hypothetical protein
VHEDQEAKDDDKGYDGSDHESSIYSDLTLAKVPEPSQG